MTTAASVLDSRLSQSIGDWIEELVTTNLAASVSVISTHLNKLDDGRNDIFNGYWVYVTDKNNAGADRYVYDYATSTGTLLVRGANFTADTAAATVRLYRYSYTDKLRAINDAIREVFPDLSEPIESSELITGNILPNSHFQDWTSSSYPDFYSVTSATAAATTTSGLYRGGNKSALVTATVADGYMYISSDTYPRLLDLMGKTISFKCWAYPSVANDAFLTIYTIKADGTAQTLNSTTTCPVSKMTLLKLENQAINDDITKIEFRFRVHTNGATCYFDAARGTGHNINELLLPLSFANGELNRVYIQTAGNAEDICDDLHPTYWQEDRNHEIVDNGTNKYLRLNSRPSELRQVRLLGQKLFTELTSYSGTINLGNEHINLLVAFAAHKLFEKQAGVASSQDVDRFRGLSDYWYNKYQLLLPSLRQTVTSFPMNLPVY